MDDIGRQLKKGVLDILLLKLLADGSTYGYELRVKLEEGSGGVFDVKEGTLYPILYRLEDGGFVESQWAQDDARRGVPRKYYAITQAGREQLRLGERELRRHYEGIWRIMGGAEHG